MTDLEITTQKPQADMVIITLKGTVRNVDNYYDLHNIFNTFLDFQDFCASLNKSFLKTSNFER